MDVPSTATMTPALPSLTPQMRTPQMPACTPVEAVVAPVTGVPHSAAAVGGVAADTRSLSTLNLQTPAGAQQNTRPRTDTHTPDVDDSTLVNKALSGMVRHASVGKRDRRERSGLVHGGKSWRLSSCVLAVCPPSTSLLLFPLLYSLNLRFAFSAGEHIKNNFKSALGSIFEAISLPSIINFLFFENFF